MSSYLYRSDWPQPHFADHVDINGRRVFATLRGQGPLVVLEPGAAGGGAWGSTVPEIAESATVLLYDRAGVGLSDPRNEPSTVSAMATDCHALLQRLDISHPAILVGWSLSGLSALCHAIDYPQDIAGLVLIDPTPHTLYDESAAASRGPNFKRQIMIQSLLARLGYGRLWGKRGLYKFLRENSGPIIDEAALVDYVESLCLIPRAAAVDELRDMEESCAIVSALLQRGLPDIPLTVLSATINHANKPQVNTLAKAAHRAMAELTPRGRMIEVDNGSHMMTLDRPDAIIAAVQEMLSEVAT